MRPLRVLAFVQKRLDLSPGQRYRIEQWVPWLQREHDIAVDFAVFESDALTEVLYQPGLRTRKAALVLTDFVRRSADVLRARSYDVAFLYREAALLGPAVYERVLSTLGVPLVLDFDDAIWLPQTAGPNGAFSLMRFPGKTATLCHLASAVTVGNEYLADYARQQSKDVVVVPTTVDLDRYSVAAPLEPENPFTIVWTGSHSTLVHLETARGAIEKLGLEREVRLRVICDRPPRPFANVDNVFVRWASSSEASDVAAAHVGIMPVPDEPFTRGKCALKGLLYMACGRPAVLSPVGVNRDIVQHGENGLLASTEGEWLDSLRQLAASPDLRVRLGRAGRATVEGGYSARRGASKLATVLRRVAR